MSVQPSTFGALRLTGEDAVKFKSQLRYGRPKQEAKVAAVRGQEMLTQFQKQGYVVKADDSQHGGIVCDVTKGSTPTALCVAVSQAHRSTGDSAFLFIDLAPFA